jgi:pimeloyl-ACP methyl ester carboxylesterase
MMEKLKWLVIAVGILVVLAVVMPLSIRAVHQWMILQESKKLIENGGISELVELEVHGTTQYIFIEGNSAEKPVLLFLHGGPGQSFPFGVGYRGAYPEITEHFVTVYYDQRGSGKSYSKKIPMESMNITQFIDDTDAIVEYVRNRFNTGKVVIAGLSWGSIVGVKYSSLYPEKVSAYIGLSQFVNHTENQRRALEWLQGIAENNHDRIMLQDLASIGEPLLTGEKEELLMKYLSKHGGENYSDERTEKADIFGMMKPALLSPDYTLGDIYKSLFSGATFSLREAKDLLAEINAVNLKTEVRELAMPVYLFQGKQDKITNYGLTKEYFDHLVAPAGKEFVTLEHSAHYPNAHDFEIIMTKLKEISFAVGVRQ